MIKCLKRCVTALLTLSLLVGIIPSTVLTTRAAVKAVYSLNNEYIKVDVSGDNGGFSISTLIGDKVNKADDNKNLLFRRGEYDTSFTSFQVTYNPGTATEKTKEYIFGGDYGFLGLKSSDVTVTQANNRIDAVWSVDNGKLTFTQSIALANPGANEHGMVSINYKVANTGSVPVEVKARILFDTAMGNQDYAFYRVIDVNEKYRSVTKETVLTTSDSIPQNFFGVDDPYNPTITSYTVSTQTDMPYQAAFGHWNNLAATVFDFAPNLGMEFTDPYNADYLTADSAYALYYDLDTLSSGGSRSFFTYYGVYAHSDTTAGEYMTVDVTSPTSLELDNDKKAYIRQTDHGIADFSVQVLMNNFVSDVATDRSSVTLAIYTANGIMPTDAKGAQIPGMTYESIDPYTLSYADLSIGETVSDVLYFKARPDVNAQYRKIRLEVYDTSKNATITAENLLGSAIFYILCPGTDGGLPKVTFTSLTPEIIYYKGTRHLFVAGDQLDYLFDYLQDGVCTMKAYKKDDKKVSVAIRKENILHPEPNLLDVILSEEMVTGAWYLQIEWSDMAVSTGIISANEKNQTAPVLNFTVTDQAKYKNDTYGVIAVVQTHKASASTVPTYRIMSFVSEDAFKKYRDDKKYVEILLVFRGEFVVKATTMEGSSYVPTYVTATSLKSSPDAKATNSVSINNCLDFENGVLVISYEKTVGGFGNVRVEFNGELYTSDSRTSVWKGEAAFTEIEQGIEFGLISYSSDGVRSDNFIENSIYLVWPSVFGVGQTIAGMVFNMAYGELGVMNDKDDNELGRIISFSAKLDLGFLIPSKENDEVENTYWTRLKNFWRFYNEGQGGMYSYWAVENVDNIIDYSNEVSGKDEGAASVMVQDILFGCGVGFVGVHFNVDVKLPNYVKGMPKIEGNLEVNTIGNWSFGVTGAMELTTFTLEAALSIKSYKNIPVPDKIYLFISGFEPGINVDCHGVIWVTGGGGGIDKLYDTIFLTDKVPPLKILLSISFDLLKVLSARADLSLALTGISLSATNVKIKSTNIVALKKAGIELNWYPDLYLAGSISMSLFDIITGSGYIVLEGKNYTDWFFEAFVRAGIGIPKSIPIVGGMNIASVDLGVSSVKIWGVLNVLFVKLGLTYYWGGDINFGSGDSMKPTYPNLLGFDDIPVYYDEETDRTLYLRVGTNLSVAAQAEITDYMNSVPRLFGIPSLYSSANGLNHKFNLGSRTGADDAIVQMTYTAADLHEANRIAGEILTGGINNTVLGKYDIVLYDGTNIDSANANVSYDAETKKATFSFTMTKDEVYNVDWSFTTPVRSDVILYNVAALPDVTSVKGTVADKKINLEWTGSNLSDLDHIKFYLVSDKTNVEESGYPLIEVNDANLATGNASILIPMNIPSGSYYVKAVYVLDGVLNEVIYSMDPVSIVNTYTPKNPSVSSAIPGGDLKFNIGLNSPGADAYIVNIYKYVVDQNTGVGSWVYSDVNAYMVDATDLVNNTISVGGSYTFEGNTYGLFAHTEYRIGITALNNIDSNNDGIIDTAVYSKEIYYKTGSNGVADVLDATSVKLPAPTPPDVKISADKKAKAISRIVGNQTQVFDTYNSSEITFIASSSEAITGTWYLDEGNQRSGSFTDQKTIPIVLTGLTQGDHTLVIKGTDSGGDGFRETYLFTVDSLAPRLMVSSPVNGSFFHKNGQLTVKGITDKDAFFTVTSDGVTAFENKSISELGGIIETDGTFAFTMDLPDPHSAMIHHIVITASDKVGNSTSVEADVVHGGLGDIKQISIYADGVKWDNGNIAVDLLNSRSVPLTLVARTSDGASFTLTDKRLVAWTCYAAEGTASIDDDGLLTIGPNSVGYVTGALRVSSTGARTSNITFGAERYSGNKVVTGASLGGIVTGGGLYDPGDTVTLTAVADTGYTFEGWTIEGASVSDNTVKTISFKMPDHYVVAIASFTAVDTGKPGGVEVLIPSSHVSAVAGELVSIPLPKGGDPNRFVSYYIKDGNRIYIPMSYVKDGYLTFVAPITGIYYMEQRSVLFTDTAGHWGESYIVFCASRDLFNGVGDNKFDPNGIMTRGMFVTVLWRLAGKPAATSPKFIDVPAGKWYSAAVAWAAENSIVKGYGNNIFGVNDPVTREQMCVIYLRYMKLLGMNIKQNPVPAGFTDQGKISAWAVDAVNVCKSLGIINGKEGGRFDPLGLATRAEGCATFTRLIKAYLESIE